MASVECKRAHTNTHTHTHTHTHTAFHCKHMKASSLPLSPHGWSDLVPERSQRPEPHTHSLILLWVWGAGEGQTLSLSLSHTHTHTHTAGCELRAGMVAEEIVVSLSGGAPWGFRLQGGAEQQKPLQVAKVQWSPGVCVCVCVCVCVAENTYCHSGNMRRWV